MVKDAEANADADKQKIEGIEARNNADSIIVSTEKNLKEHGSKLPKEDKAKIEKGVEELKKCLENEKVDAKTLKEKTDSLVQDSMKLGEILYKEAQEKAAKESASDNKDKDGSKKTKSKSKTTDKGKNDKVVDADFEDVTDSNKEKKPDDKSTGASA